MLKTKREILKWAEENGVEIEHSVNRNYEVPFHHVHAYCNSGKRFNDFDLHNLSLWDTHKAPNWPMIGKELLEAGLGECKEINCEWCEE